MKTLKKIIVPFAAVIYMAAISSCNILGGVLSGIEEINNEAEEIASGKVFTVDKGVVTYNDGITFTVDLVVCLALCVTVIIAKIVGGTLPLVAKILGADPAVMASPFITTIVDAVSLLVYFMFAKMLLPI